MRYTYLENILYGLPKQPTSAKILGMLEMMNPILFLASHFEKI